MKRFIAAMFLAVGISQAGPVKAAYIVTKTAVYPLHHPKKDMHAAEKVAKFGGKVVKTVAW
jgi:hypothetical protein